MNRLLSLITLLFLIPSCLLAQNAGDLLFDPSQLHELRFYSETEPDLYATLQEEALTREQRNYYMVQMIFDGEQVDSVAIRAKGFFSSVSDQTPIKVDLNEFAAGQMFDGIKKFNLGNSFLDGYRQKDRLSYELMRRAGIPAPRTSYVTVYINDVFIEIYLLTQQIDKTFIWEHFADKGSLAKYGREPIYGDFSEIEPYGRGEAEVLDRVNLRDYFKFMAINEILQASDNYPSNNFYVHHSEKSDRLTFLPWDYNLVLNTIPESFTSLSPMANSDEIFNDPALKELYLEVNCELANYLLDETFIDNFMEANASIISTNMEGATVENYNELKEILVSSRPWLFEKLMEEGYSCGSFNYPLASGDLVINEIVAKNDSIGGVLEPDGGSPDWIELFNNTDQDITLDHHFYLSDDVDFPKKWNFESPVVIPANGYQIIWADRDVDQQGVHANFKLKKSGGDLLLVYEDQTVIDQISYGEQEANQGYARVPNGTGDFIIQDFTFGSNNDEGTTSSTNSSAFAANVSVYPNPVRGRLQVVTPETISNLRLYSTDGRLVTQLSGHNTFVDLADVPAGMYFLHITTEKGYRVLRISHS